MVLRHADDHPHNFLPGSITVSASCYSCTILRIHLQIDAMFIVRMSDFLRKTTHRNCTQRTLSSCENYVGSASVHCYSKLTSEWFPSHWMNWLKVQNLNILSVSSSMSVIILQRLWKTDLQLGLWSLNDKDHKMRNEGVKTFNARCTIQWGPAQYYTFIVMSMTGDVQGMFQGYVRSDMWWKNCNLW
jgi:hypothetical protein